MSSHKILVLGAGGFIGRPLVAALQQKYRDAGLIAWSGEHDISRTAIIEEIMAVKPDVIVLLAGKSFVPDSWQDPLAFYRVNTNGTIHIAEAARRCNSKIVFLSTFVYGEPYILPITENNTVRSFNPYASSKLIAEQILQDFNRHFGVQSNILRVFNVYGEGQRTDFLIPMLVEQYLQKQHLHVKDLKPRRDYVYLDDLVRAVVSAVEVFDGCQVYNVAGGRSYSVEEVISAIFKAGGKIVPVTSEEASRPNEVMDTLADITKISEKLGWKPAIDFSEGIRRMLQPTGSG